MDEWQPVSTAQECYDAALQPNRGASVPVCMAASVHVWIRTVNNTNSATGARASHGLSFGFQTEIDSLIRGVWVTLCYCARVCLLANFTQSDCALCTAVTGDF